MSFEKSLLKMLKQIKADFFDLRFIYQATGGKTMELKHYRAQALTQMLQLFCDTVHSVNAGDYNQAQQEAWAPYSVLEDEQTRTRWHNSLQQHLSLVAWEGGQMAGFADMDVQSGYLDRLYVSRDFQRQGVATLLVQTLEQAAKDAGCESVTSDVSITARPFFESRGYRVLRQQQVERKGVVMTNFKMEKIL